MCHCWSRGSDWCCPQLHPLEACCRWNFGARQVQGGSSEGHTSSRLCFVEDGLTWLLHMCSGLDGADEEFVWKEGWPEKTSRTVSCSVFTMPIDQQGSPCWLLTTPTSACSGHRGGTAWQWPIGSMSSSVMSWDFNLDQPVDGRLRVHCLPGECFQQRCQAYKVWAGGGLVHVWGAFHNGAKSPLVLPDRYLTGEFYRGILRNTLVPFAKQHFGDNNPYQDDNVTSHHASVVLDFLQQGNVTKTEHTVKSPDCNTNTYLGWIGQCNNQYGHPVPEYWWAPSSPAG